MKLKALTTKLAIVAAVISLMAVTLCSCGAKAVNVTIKDRGETSTVEGTEDMTVEQLLQKAELKLGSKDEVEPKKDVKWSEAKAKEITIKRYAKVTVVFDTEKKEVELVGGTVADAIDKAGFKLTDGVEADKEKDSYLEDGMTITLTKANSVTLTVDGKTTVYNTKSATVKDFLNEHKVKLGKDDEVKPSAGTKLKDGDEVVVKRVEYKEEKRKEKVKFTTENVNDPDLTAGETKVTQQGVEGEKEVTYKVKYVDGKATDKKKLSEKVTKEPVNEIIANGTKQESVVEQSSQVSHVTQQSSQASQASQAPQAATQRTVVSKQKVLDCDGSGHGYYVIKYSDGNEEYEEF